MDPVPAVPVSAADVEARARIDALADEAWPLRFSDQARAAALAGEALRLAQAADYPVGVALALRTLGAQQFYFQSDLTGADARFRLALDLLDQAGETRGRADVLNLLGSVNRLAGRQVDSMRLHLAALELARQQGDRMAEALALGSIGSVYHLLGDYGRALEHHQASLALREEIGDETGMGYPLINIGIIHGMMGEPERTIEHMRRAFTIQERGDPHSADVCLVNLGNAYLDLGQDERALEFLERAYTRLSARGSHADEASCLCDIGRIHERRGEDARALACYQRSRALLERTGSRIYLPEVLMRLGALRVRTGEAPDGLADLRAALVSAEEQGARQHVHAAHEALARAYEQLGDAARALEHHRAFHAVWREVYGNETNARIQHALVRAEVEQTQREAELLRERNEALTRADEEKARLLDQLRAQAAELERQTREDALTRVSNRRHLDAQLATEWERALRFGRALTVAMVDVDHFKQINDRFTHAVGDEVLRTVARILRDNTRGVDVVARYGGEEFCLILVETRSADAVTLCDRLRGLIADHDWSSIRPGIAVTVSIGVAGLHEGADAPDALLAAADVRLYAAKHAGRNRVLA
ncbi:diguanylate cyclase [Longimicrobium sp.]|uniref:diguanylate cyclase n=1 Tax=Longimicrobium sp. TaxID=2029185 RepID=UPI002E30DA29|nr:diguanylate cyclase [Longimicrobium sp.]HEX6039009.1 diguanylate cyclase [Longimicrobium sp.]